MAFVSIAIGAGSAYWANLYLAFVFFAAAVIIPLSLKMANVWQKFVVLRMGKLQSIKGAGLFGLFPFWIASLRVIAGRIQITAFNAEHATSRCRMPCRGKRKRSAKGKLG